MCRVALRSLSLKYSRRSLGATAAGSNDSASGGGWPGAQLAGEARHVFSVAQTAVPVLVAAWLEAVPSDDNDVADMRDREIEQGYESGLAASGAVQALLLRSSLAPLHPGWTVALIHSFLLPSWYGTPLRIRQQHRTLMQRTR